VVFMVGSDRDTCSMTGLLGGEVPISLVECPDGSLWPVPLMSTVFWWRICQFLRCTVCEERAPTVARLGEILILTCPRCFEVRLADDYPESGPSQFGSSELGSSPSTRSLPDPADFIGLGHLPLVRLGV
jgi:hypothetical protein